MFRNHRRAAACAVAALALGLIGAPAPSSGERQQDQEEKQDAQRQERRGRKARKLTKARQKELIERLSPEHRAWLEEVDLIISDDERRTFLEIEKDYQRDAFIERFWRIRDPYPDTTRNEYKDHWDARVREVRETIGALEDDRAKVLLLNGFPDGQVVIRCASTWPAEVWYYERAETVGHEVLLLFYQRYGNGPFLLWYAQDGVQSLLRFPPPAISGRNLISEVVNSCSDEQSSALVAAIRFASINQLSFSSMAAKLQQPPEPPSKEWVATFHAYTTDVPEDADTFSAELELEFPARRQSRTVVQGLLSVPVAEAGVGEYADHRSFNYVLTGEVLRDGKLFDSFRYRFNLAAEEIQGDYVPMVFERYLRPGEYLLAVRLEDLNHKAYFGLQREFEVPVVEGAPIPEPEDEETRRLLAEANAAIASGATTLQIVPPRGRLQTGMQRIDTLSTGKDIAQVSFSLDGQPILTKRSPPWSVELDLGSLPRMRTLAAVAYDSEGREVARDRVELNAGSHRFAVNLVEPRRGVRYEKSLRAEAEVDVPEGGVVERVEFYLNEQLVATHYQPPFTQAIFMGSAPELSYVRAVAYQPDGNATEDTVFINAPDYMENLKIQFVELYIAALDKNKRPVQALTETDFAVYEDGQPQIPMRFEQVTNLPIHAGILIDVSASMEESLATAREAALKFFELAIQPRDRATLITFNDHPNLEVKFTNDLASLAGGLAGLKAERGTALYDSLVFSLYYFNGLKGQRALILLSDGHDEHSRFAYEDTLEYARRAGVALYTIGLQLPKKKFDIRRKLTRLAEETGGRSFFVSAAAELPAIYEAIQNELRSRYYLAYQSSNTADDNDFRAIDVKIARAGVEAKTLRGYYP